MAETMPAAAAPKKNIVILGASFAGMSAAHYFLRHIYPVLPNKETYKVTLVDESSKLYARPASPRAVVSYDLMPKDKIFHDIAGGFKSYTPDQFSFLQGSASSLDTAAKAVTISLPSGAQETVSYYALIIATGFRQTSPILGLHGDFSITVAAQEAFQKALPEANTIVIAGGGPSAVETAGEIAEQLNGKPGMFSSITNPRCKISVITSADKLLPMLRPAIATQAETLLKKLGVEVLYNTRVESVSPEGTGSEDSPSSVTQKCSVKLSNGETREADLYIPATGVVPNTKFVPAALLNEKGYVDNNKETLRVDAAGPFVYAVGDVGSHTRGGVMEIYSAIPVVMNNMKRDLLAPEGEKPLGKDMVFKPNTKETHLVPVGRSKGVGAIFGMKLPSLAVWAIKGRDYFASTAPAIVDGSKWKTETKWDAAS